MLTLSASILATGVCSLACAAVASEVLKADSGIVLAAVRNGGDPRTFERFRHAEYPEAVVRVEMSAAKATQGGPLRLAAPELRADKPIVLEAVQRNGGALNHASEELCGDLDVVLAAVGQTGAVLDTVADDMLGVREVVLLAVRTAPDVLQFAEPTLQADREIVLIAVSQCGAALEDASDDLADDHEVVLAAVNNNGLALKFAGELVQADRDVVLAAVRQNPGAVEFVAASLKDDREIISAAANGCSVDIHTTPTMPQLLVGDGKRLKQLAGAGLYSDDDFWRTLAFQVLASTQVGAKRSAVTAVAAGADFASSEPLPLLLASGEDEMERERQGVEQLIDAFITKQLQPTPPASTRGEGGKDVTMRTEADLALLSELRNHDVVAPDAAVVALVDGTPLKMDAAATEEAKRDVGSVAKEVAEATVPIAAAAMPFTTGSPSAWAAVDSFRPCALELSTLPASVALLTNLTLLWAHGNQLGTLPAVLPSKLTELCLHRNALTVLSEATIAPLTSLKLLWLHSNRLAALPNSLGLLKSLEELSIYDNRLRRLPASVGNLTALRRLSVEHNELTSLPPEIGALYRLAHLDVSNNKLTGLPRTIGKLQALSTLVVWANRLAALPSEICELGYLMALSASQNALVDLPERFGEMRDSLRLDLMDNPLQKVSHSTRTIKPRVKRSISAHARSLLTRLIDSCLLCTSVLHRSRRLPSSRAVWWLCAATLKSYRCVRQPSLALPNLC